MKKASSSVPTKIAALLGGYIAALAAAGSESERFRSFMVNLLGYRFGVMLPDLALSIVLFLFCAALLGVSVWFSRGGRARKLDYSVLAVSLLSVVLLCVVYALDRRGTRIDFIPITWRWLAFATVAYAAGMALSAAPAANGF